MSALDQVLTIGIVKTEHPNLHKEAAAELAALRSEWDALKAVAQAAKDWRKSWPDEKDVLEAKEESCPCAICELIRACDALAGDE